MYIPGEGGYKHCGNMNDISRIWSTNRVSDTYLKRVWIKRDLIKETVCIWKPMPKTAARVDLVLFVGFSEPENIWESIVCIQVQIWK
jgi:hypothetical protein